MSFYLENPPKQFTAMCLTENIASLFIYLFVYLFVQYLNIYLFINLFIYIYISHLHAASGTQSGGMFVIEI